MPEVSSGGPVVAIVPARGGSKRIPRKNIRLFRGVPLLARTVSTLVRAELFDHVVVSTDDDEIADVALSAGAEVPFLRPASLAEDQTPTGPVIVHAIATLEDMWTTRVGPICVVYPAAVLTGSEDLRAARDLLQSSPDVSYVLAATTYAAPVQRALRLREDGSCEMVWPEHRMTRSQDLEETYHDAGQFYWGTRTAWVTEEPVFTQSTRLHVLPRWRVQDIDTPEDWERAELIFDVLQRRE